MGDPNHHRCSIRLKGYEYSQCGAYFITMVTQDRRDWLGDIVDEMMKLNDAGRMIRSVWLDMANRFYNVSMGEFQIMPNHFHGIIILNDNPRRGGPCVRPNGDPKNNNTGRDRVEINPTPTNIDPNPNIDTNTNTNATIGDIICAFKSISTNRYINGVNMGLVPRFKKRLWQRNYYEHIIRNENEYNRIGQYIYDNPIKWGNDKLNNESGNRVMESVAEYGIEPWMV